MPEPPAFSSSMLVRMAAADVAVFRFLLESHENLAIFTTLGKNPVIIRLLYAPGSRDMAINALGNIGKMIELEWEDWPFS